MQFDLLDGDPTGRMGDAAPARTVSEIRGMVARAVKHKAIHLAFQPVLSVDDAGQPAFFEALVRLVDDAGVERAAGAFIDEIEPWELGRTIDCMALERGLSALRENPRLHLSVNLSARSLEHRPWQRTLEHGLTGVEDVGGRLILEVTERSAMGMPGVVTREMAGLRARGVRLALDDFGAGCTSFRYLKAFRFDIFKIDGQFIRGIHADSANRAMTKAFVDVARHFEMKTVAEMVESRRDASCLRALGVDYLQGYLLGRPARVCA